MTKQIVTAPLDLDNYSTESETETCITLDVWSYWNTHGYPINGIVEAHSTVSLKDNDEDNGHTVLKVKTLSKPQNRADVVADSIEKWCCDCRGFRYHYNVDLQQQRLPAWGVCPHIEAVSKVERAKQDDSQEQLV